MNIGELDQYDLVKTHDFGLRKKRPLKWLREFPKKSGLSYLVMVRDPIRSAMSDFELLEKKELKRPGTRQEWDSYAPQAIDYRKAFFKKWLPSQLSSNMTAVSYENFLADPLGELLRILENAFLLKEIDRAKAETIFSWKDISERRDYSSFKFYDEEQIRGLRSRISSEVERVNEHHKLNLPM